MGTNGYLSAGSFYSQVAASDRRCGFVMSELLQPVPRKIPHHSHEWPYFTLVLAGHYNEGDAHGTHELHPFTAIFNPDDCRHWGAVGAGGARMFTVEIRPEQLTWCAVRLPDTPVHDPGSPGVVLKMLRLYHEFRSGPHMEPLEAESLVCEMVAAAARYTAADRDDAPGWWARIEELLHARCTQPLRIAELAAEAGVHPVHLARVFRRKTGMTPGESLQAYRVRKACFQLLSRERSLVDVAMDCGFADQSHMTRLFRRYIGLTPAAFRSHSAQKKSGREVPAA